MVPEQCLMARAALRLTRAELAVAANVAISTIVRFESGGDTRVSSINSLQAALERAGVTFMAAGAPSLNGGPGVRLQ